MSSKRVIPFLTMLLALNFVGQIVLSASNTELAQFAIELENDGEKEEVENEKEADKLTQQSQVVVLGKKAKSALSKVHIVDDWVSPTLETLSPPPELV